MKKTNPVRKCMVEEERSNYTTIIFAVKSAVVVALHCRHLFLLDYHLWWLQAKKMSNCINILLIKMFAYFSKVTFGFGKSRSILAFLKATKHLHVNFQGRRTWKNNSKITNYNRLKTLQSCWRQMNNTRIVSDTNSLFLFLILDLKNIGGPNSWIMNYEYVLLGKHKL